MKKLESEAEADLSGLNSLMVQVPFHKSVTEPRPLSIEIRI